jgi:hypothetical protein
MQIAYAAKHLRVVAKGDGGKRGFQDGGYFVKTRKNKQPDTYDNPKPYLIEVRIGLDLLKTYNWLMFKIRSDIVESDPSFDKEFRSEESFNKINFSLKLKYLTK